MEARQKTQYWHLWIKELRTGIKYNKMRARLRSQFIGIEPREDQPEHKPNLTTAIRLHRKAKTEYKNIKQKAKELRRSFLEERAAAEALCSNKKTEQILRRIIAAKESKDDFSLIRRLLGKTKTGGIQSLLVPTGEVDNEGQPTYERLVDQQQIEQRLLERNRQHFAQAKGTPFTTSPLYSLFGWHGTGKYADKVLNGKLDIDALDTTQATKSILRRLKRDENQQEIDTYVSGEDFYQGFKNWREDTSTSPSGQDLSQYKAFYKFPKVHRVKQDKEEPPPEHERLFNIIAAIANIALKHSHPLQRWRKVVNAMIEKIPGFPRIEKLRVIHLYEADVNLLLGVLWGRRLQQHGESEGRFGQEQWGSRRHRCSIDVAILKALSYNIAELTHTMLATFDNDAKACYDRIVVAKSTTRHAFPRLQISLRIPPPDTSPFEDRYVNI